MEAVRGKQAGEGRGGRPERMQIEAAVGLESVAGGLHRRARAARRSQAKGRVGMESACSLAFAMAHCMIPSLVVVGGTDHAEWSSQMESSHMDVETDVGVAEPQGTA